MFVNARFRVTPLRFTAIATSPVTSAPSPELPNFTPVIASDYDTPPDTGLAAPLQTGYSFRHLCQGLDRTVLGI